MQGGHRAPRVPGVEWWKPGFQVPPFFPGEHSLETRLGALGQRPLGSGSGASSTSVPASQSWEQTGRVGGGMRSGGGNARAKSLDHVGCPGGPQERHPRSEAMNASGEGDSFPGSVQSKYYWTDAPSVGSVQRAGPGIWDPGDGAPCMPSPPAPREAGLGAELL